MEPNKVFTHKDMTDIEDLICKIVEEKQGCKVTELAADPRVAIGGINFLTALKHVIDSGLIVEVEYVLSNMDYRIKSFLLPKGTRIL